MVVVILVWVMLLMLLRYLMLLLLLLMMMMLLIQVPVIPRCLLSAAAVVVVVFTMRPSVVVVILMTPLAVGVVVVVTTVAAVVVGVGCGEAVVAGAAGLSREIRAGPRATGRDAGTAVVLPLGLLLHVVVVVARVGSTPVACGQKTRTQLQRVAVAAPLVGLGYVVRVDVTVAVTVGIRGCGRKATATAGIAAAHVTGFRVTTLTLISTAGRVVSAGVGVSAGRPSPAPRLVLPARELVPRLGDVPETVVADGGLDQGLDWREVPETGRGVQVVEHSPWQSRVADGGQEFLYAGLVLQPAPLHPISGRHEHHVLVTRACVAPEQVTHRGPAAVRPPVRVAQLREAPGQHIKRVTPRAVPEHVPGRLVHVAHRGDGQ